MKRKRWLGLLLATAMMLALLPMTAFAAPTQVYMGGGYLSDGANSVGGGTATLDVTQNTLTPVSYTHLDVYKRQGDRYIPLPPRAR